MKWKSSLISCILFLVFSSIYTDASAIVKPYALQCEHLISPIGVDVSHPRLSWKMDDQRLGAKQTAYRIYVGNDSSMVKAKTGNSWDSQKINAATSLITYQGNALRPFTKYYWMVELWDHQGRNSTSAVSSFETGMMGMENWQGTWISDGNNIIHRPAPYFRKVFEPFRKIKSARVYIAAAGLYELYLNGKKVGNHRLDPMFTRFDRRTLYVAYDVTAALQEGKNAIGVLLGNGWYNMQSLAVWNFDTAPWRARPAFCLDLRLTYEDGTTEVITSGQDWKTHSGAVIFNSIYTAEHEDRRLEQQGWNTVNFDDKQWKNARLRAAPATQIVSQLMHPIRNVETIAVQSLKKINDTTYLFDLGRNIAGVSQLTIEGAAGTTLRLKHGERLTADGRLDLSNIDVYYRPKDKSDPFQTDIFILSGRGKETFMPKFNYKGFQYVEVTSNVPVQLSKNSLTGYFMHSDVPVAGKLKSSNPLLNQLWAATNNSYLSNLFGYPTDCPQREKNGWTGDGHFAIETGLYNFDALTIYEKWMADHRDEQQPNGVLPDIIPTGGWGYGTDNGTDWTSTIAIIPWNIYLFYGDSQLLQNNYGNMKKYVDYITRRSPNGLTSWGRGDWVPVKSRSPLEFTSSVYYFVDATIMAKAAKLFGQTGDQRYYTALAEKIKKAVNDKYYNPQTGIYGNGLQTELSVALQWGLVADSLKTKVAANLAQRVKADGMHLDVGVLGAKAILNALSENGQEEIAYQLAVQNTYPSWGWWIVNGATTLYENWDIKAATDISLNHMMFGEIGAWFFKGLGGILIDEQHPGFKHVLLKPHFVSGLTYFEAEHEGPYGPILSSWKRKGEKVVYEVLVPANSTATVYFPLKDGQHAYQGNKAVSDTLTIEAGHYQFEIK
ncbi:glycoside hydrolase family 78 protein [Pedobacter sp.]|uniref:glycoside hydrolase family 78 protein n=1 Tax=Pedobacter sp. TaxID=1411316 RepID=UPI003D7F2466